MTPLSRIACGAVARRQCQPSSRRSACAIPGRLRRRGKISGMSGAPPPLRPEEERLDGPRSPTQTKRDWAPPRAALARAPSIAAVGAFALVVLLTLRAGSPAMPPATPTLVLAGASFGGWVVCRAMFESDCQLAVLLGLAGFVLTGFAMLGWCLATPIWLLGLAGSEGAGVGLAAVAGGALGWSGAQWSVAVLAHMLGGVDEDGA